MAAVLKLYEDFQAFRTVVLASSTVLLYCTVPVDLQYSCTYTAQLYRYSCTGTGSRALGTRCWLSAGMPAVAVR